MDRKERESFVIALSEKGKSYREIAEQLKMSPNTIKAIKSKAGIDESISMSSRAFQLFEEGKTPLQVAMKLDLDAERAIGYHVQYLRLLGVYDFTRVYQIIKEDPWPYVKIVQLIQNAGMTYDQVVELNKIANGYLPRIKLEYEGLKAEMRSIEARTRNAVIVFQQFNDQIIEMNKRVNELQSTINRKKDEIRELDSRLEKSLLKCQENQSQDEGILMNDVQSHSQIR